MLIAHGSGFIFGKPQNRYSKKVSHVTEYIAHGSFSLARTQNFQSLRSRLLHTFCAQVGPRPPSDFFRGGGGRGFSTL